MRQDTEQTDTYIKEFLLRREEAQYKDSEGWQNWWQGVGTEGFKEIGI